MLWISLIGLDVNLRSSAARVIGPVLLGKFLWLQFYFPPAANDIRRWDFGFDSNPKDGEAQSLTPNPWFTKAIA